MVFNLMAFGKSVHTVYGWQGMNIECLKLVLARIVGAKSTNNSYCRFLDLGT